MEREILMVSSASIALNFYNKNPNAIDEEIFQHLADHISNESIKDEKTKRNMIASANMAIKLKRNTPNSEKQILRKIIQEIPRIIQELD